MVAGRSIRGSEGFPLSRFLRLPAYAMSCRLRLRRRLRQYTPHETPTESTIRSNTAATIPKTVRPANSLVAASIGTADAFPPSGPTEIPNCLMPGPNATQFIARMKPAATIAILHRISIAAIASNPSPHNMQPIPSVANIADTATIHGNSPAVKACALGTTPQAAKTSNAAPNRNEKPNGMAAIRSMMQPFSRVSAMCAGHGVGASHEPASVGRRVRGSWQSAAPLQRVGHSIRSHTGAEREGSNVLHGLGGPRRHTKT